MAGNLFNLRSGDNNRNGRGFRIFVLLSLFIYQILMTAPNSTNNAGASTKKPAISNSSVNKLQNMRIGNIGKNTSGISISRTQINSDGTKDTFNYCSTSENNASPNGATANPSSAVSDKMGNGNNRKRQSEKSKSGEVKP